MPATGARSTVTIVGSSSSIPRPDRACSCYLVRRGDLAFTLDMGSGSFANLRGHVAAEDLGAVVISHMHPDHFLDLIPMRYALRYGPRANGRRVPVFLPPGGDTMLRRLVDAFHPEECADYLAEVYEISTYDPAQPLRLGDATLAFSPTAHYIPTFAVRYEADGARLTFSADTAPEPRVSALGRSSDVFLCEATLRPGEIEPNGHSSAREAGTMARNAGARRLVLTHYGSETNDAELISEARGTFDGEITVADDHLKLAIG
jgi:ribonuclease BN (tRNA processing enzyme)